MTAAVPHAIVTAPVHRTRLPAATSVYYFDPFVLDVRSGELRRGQQTVLLQDQPFRILRRLIEAGGAVVRRDDLCAAVWDGRTFVDYEHGLNAAVRRLRRALGDDAAAPRYVETVARCGYRLKVPITAAGIDGGRAGRPQTERPRLAVLPLAHTGIAAGFADGLTEELMVQVGRLTRDSVALVARSTARHLDCAPAPPPGRATAWQVDYVLDGSVRADGRRVRVAAWLIETHGETQIWADTVEGCLRRPLSLQVAMATHLAQSLVGGGRERFRAAAS